MLKSVTALANAHLQKADTVTASDLARLVVVFVTPTENSFARNCSVIFIRNSSLGSSVCTQHASRTNIPMNTGRGGVNVEGGREGGREQAVSGKLIIVHVVADAL